MPNVLKSVLMNGIKEATASQPNLSRKAIVSEQYRQTQAERSLTTMPTSKSLLELVTRERTRSNLSVFSSLEQIEIPIDLQMFSASERFLLYDSGPSEDRVLVFASRQCAEIMEKSDHLFIDGTFDAVPSQFYQTISVHGE